MSLAKRIGALVVTPGLPAEPPHGAWNGRRQDLSVLQAGRRAPRAGDTQAPEPKGGWEGRRGCVARRLASLLACSDEPPFWRSGGGIGYILATILPPFAPTIILALL
jgi:hypothetical protein